MLYFPRVWKGEVMAWHKYKDGSGEYYRGYNPYTGEFFTETDRKHRKAAEARAKAAKKRKKKEESSGCGIAFLYFFGILIAIGAIVAFIEAAIQFILEHEQELFIAGCVIAALSLVIGLIWLWRKQGR